MEYIIAGGAVRCSQGSFYYYCPDVGVRRADDELISRNYYTITGLAPDLVYEAVDYE
jgi:hypothetical protein